MPTSSEMPDFPAKLECPYHPPRIYESFRAEGPAIKVQLWDGSNCWVVTRYNEVRKVLANKNLSSDVTRPGYPFLSATRAARLKNYDKTPYFLHMDPPQHTQHRRMLTRDFSIAEVNKWRPFIEDSVDRLIDDILAGPKEFDLVQALALPLPTAVITKMLGVPFEDLEYFHHLSTAHSQSGLAPEEVVKASNDLAAYMRDLVVSKVDEPGEDLLTKLVHEQMLPGHISEDDLTEMARLLLIAGHETTAAMVSLGTMTLLRHPDQMEELRNNPDLMPSAVEELLRYHTILHLSSARVATGDIEIGDQTIKAGEGIVVLTSSANRDESKYEHADQFDIHRNPRDHVAFSFGPHQCLGQPFARLELDIVFRALLTRIPNLRMIGPVEDLNFADYIIGLVSLPVAWE